jgi:mannose/fructose/N-acetylgalactosamine-specific phosphotransferase system component IIB
VIFDDAVEGTAESSTGDIEVQIRVRLVKENAASANDLMQHASQALHGALVALGMPHVQQVIDTWHEERAEESRAMREV